MKKTIWKTLLALCLALALTPALAEGLGDLPQAGLFLPLTQEDADAGFWLETTIEADSFTKVTINYTDQQLLSGYVQEYISPDVDEVTAAMMEKELEQYSTYPAGEIILIDAASYETMTANGGSVSEALGIDNLFVLGENDGYVYVARDYNGLVTSQDAELMASITKVMARANELMTAATFQPIVAVEGTGKAFPAFATTDLNGEPVTSDIFAGKDLTVVNVWGTYCGPCIDEMDELAAWSSEMPDNVQLIGLVSDLYSLGDTDTLETALAICDATGAGCYTHLVVSADLVDLLVEVTGVPTTFFVDGNGNIVGEPIIGADVPACQRFVEEYLNAQ